MPTIAEVREALAGAASVSLVPCYPYEADTITVPSFYVTRDEFDPRLVFSQAKAQLTFTLIGYFDRTATESGLRTIDALCEWQGDGSMVAAVQDGDNWSTTVDYASVTRIGRTELVDVGGVTYLSVQFDVEVVW